MIDSIAGYSMPISQTSARAVRRRRQAGVVLIIALIVLVAMSLAGIALFRQVGTGLTIAGNLAFKQNATLAGDQGIEAGLKWLVENPTILDNDQVRGYFSSWDAGFSPPTFDWANKATSVGTDSAGNAVNYVIHRLCESPNSKVNDSGQKCVTKIDLGGGGSRGTVSYGILPLSNTVQPYFRLTAAIDGPRSTKSYVQLIMY